MKTTITILFTSLILLTNCKITDKNENRPITSDMISKNEADAPIMTFENEVFELKNVVVGATVKHQFKFENTGKSALLLFDVKASCGCTVLKGWPKEPIAPGEKGEIPIEFTPNVTGNNLKTVSIVANTIPSTKKLTIKGLVIGKN